MSTLVEIETAADSLSSEEKEELLRFLAMRLRGNRGQPKPRLYSDDELTFDWPIAFEASKDKPVLFSALACADVLLTLDRRDFREFLGQTVYGLRVLTPGELLRIERETGKLC